jgi:PD-(D/E)XK nuclease superfamily
MPHNPYAGLSVPLSTPSPIKRRYSVTQDVIGFRRCARQYGAFNIHKYAPAHETQFYFGTIIHQVLDRCHAHYRGMLNPATQGQVPDDGTVLSSEELEQFLNQPQLDAATPPPSEIVGYFLEVEDGLKSRGIRAITPDLRVKAVRILQYFNALEGPVLYPRVVDTEHRLQADRGSHILHGVVDLLANADGGSEGFENREMWDYKGQRRELLTMHDLENYEFQMRVYAHLYRVKHGVLPKKAMLYFLNELDGGALPTKRPVNAVLEVSLDGAEVETALASFGHTVDDIEAARLADQWDPAAPGAISDQDCAICDLRWDCPTPKNVAMRYP